MNVLITGFTGFIGGHILNHLKHKQDVDIIYAVSRKKTKPDTEGKIIEINVDLLDFNKLKSELCRVDVSAIINCVGKLGGPLISKSDLLLANYVTLKNLVDVCNKLQNIDQFIHISSFGVLGPIPDDKIPADEKYPYNPSNVYEESKMMAEKYLIRNSMFPYTILRPEFVYGPKDMHVLPFFKKIIESKFILIDGGKSYLHPTYIYDIVSAIDKVLLNKKAKNEVFNIAGEKYLRVKELAELIYYTANGKNCNFKSLPSCCLYPIAAFGEILKFLKFELPLNIQRLRFFTENRAVNFKKAKNLLDYKPYPLEAGLKETIRWYRENGYL